MKNISLILSVILSILQIINPVNAENSSITKPETLSLRKAIETAQANNPEFKAQKEKLNISDAEIITASTIQNPSVITDYSYAENTYRVGIQGLLESPNKMDLRIARANTRKQIISDQINLVTLELKTDIRRTYTELYNLKKQEEKYLDLLKINNDLLNISKKREAAGDIANLETLQSEILSLNTTNSLETIRYRIILIQNKLSSLMNKALPENIELTDPGFSPYCLAVNNLKPKNLGFLVNLAYRTRPEINENTSNQTLAKLETDIARANINPDFAISTGMSLVTDNYLKPGIFITSNFPLLLFNKQQGPIQEGISRQAQLEKQVKSVKNTISLEVTNALTAFIKSKERIEYYEKEILPKSLNIVKKSQRSFEVGKSPILIPLNAYQAYVDIQFVYLQSLFNYQNSITDLERSIGCV